MASEILFMPYKLLFFLQEVTPIFIPFNPLRVPQAPQALRVWLVSAVSSVCLDSVEREVSLVFLDLL